MENPAFKDTAAADARAGEQTQYATRLGASAKPIFTIGARIHIVEHQHGPTQCPLQLFAQWQIMPTQIGRGEYHPLGHIYRTRNPNSNATDLFALNFRLPERVQNQRFHSVDNRFGAFLPVSFFFALKQ